MLLPKKVKHRKWHKPRRAKKGVATRLTTVAFGSFGLKSMNHAWITSRQIEAARRVLTRYVKRGGKIWIRVFPDRPVTKKGNEVPMGGGKGSPDHYVSTVKPGTVLFEMEGIPEKDARTALLLSAYKLPLKAKFVLRG
ncbi:MAG: 50S ribosomal protein L16 [Candidatus Magasanikbacteria bacterium RIFCSPHIGHO2_01_FULL_41_23]|uniref:Large ribosomal subunit protein uL16 n=1 Tax=Candidatus Magasanikbacteria bacterium RIFCSPLOWO2_01_FULL_40_15 TaxID=1798686 RepID=A0A1F6N266_9BACT|nr:MAG: 50S ribosomal protein L16 [Candidatus Magasanikbacteria bacterium RIFCSPHIGHO2_01_FULL_41_23]OGH66819.1 MAG: 50S ribosomal protein L16 [Candidatus Magasanikbacteria bacterium RIFCSPHIGHO2_02_FULL_41_35]OGH76661.1 MAG: 50S ribosomal protein L16 [Candidatus Magasanikbacteria bacterium RIFCSPHIGHO2_12_FULL_41_16]OGH77997.1 MAG: 50S ribosomal protein L16 [Candidatus Magasanikbacteria bacterium RIFCSPLOWO2_01_FULL_40_15]